ncbi:hypothetical protein BT96DRAFT_960444 [Gymnopus androsaceus JB14]|uniref:DDE-1 domain-containing protein n=1 Tax=Gymnopus androsaceus JB14 TaxID=1447944 RepID=A0A6A4GNZ9_9AGAR|nr:hypothetical protein BT96DRAFT_960444 [Gymnopus androsaceus JB14]
MFHTTHIFSTTAIPITKQADEAWVTQNHKILAVLHVNTDQTQTVYAPGMKLTWNKASEKQISIVGMDNKQAFTLIPSIFVSGEELKFSFEPSGKDAYWSTMDIMKSLMTNIIAPYVKAKKKELGISNPEYHSSLWKIDCWTLHKSKEFLGWMKKTHLNIIIIFVLPGDCAYIFQPLDVGIQ